MMLLLFVGRDKPQGNWLKCEQVLKISGCRAGCHRKFVQVVQNQNVNIVKTRLVFQTIDGNAETLSGGFNDLFSGC